ncbi:MAG: NAD-dependent epimerase/dehydratase family protein [bacterium]
MKKIVLFGSDTFLGKAIIKVAEGSNQKIIPIPTNNAKRIDMIALILGEIRPDIAINTVQARGGILYMKKYPGEIFYQNASFGIEFMEQLRLYNVPKVVNILSNCCYPDNITIPFEEEDFWKGLPESNVMAQAMSLRNLAVQAVSYRRQYGMQTANLVITAIYGEGDAFDEENAQVIPAMITKFCRAVRNKENTVTLWGTGNATREFLYVEDAAKGVIEASMQYDGEEVLNIASGIEITIRELANIIAEICDYRGQIIWNTSMPEGIQRKCLSNKKIKSLFNFTPSISLEEGITRTVQWYKKNIEDV